MKIQKFGTLLCGLALASFAFAAAAASPQSSAIEKAIAVDKTTPALNLMHPASAKTFAPPAAASPHEVLVGKRTNIGVDKGKTYGVIDEGARSSGTVPIKKVGIAGASQGGWVEWTVGKSDIGAGEIGLQGEGLGVKRLALVDHGGGYSGDKLRDMHLIDKVGLAIALHQFEIGGGSSDIKRHGAAGGHSSA